MFIPKLSDGPGEPWDSLASPPVPGSEPTECLRFAALAAITAPSPGNTQPWSLHLQEEQLDIYSSPEHSLPVRDPDGQQRLVAGGAALGLVLLTLRALGLATTCTRLPSADANHLARVQLTGSITPAPEETWLLQALPKRRTYRGPMADRPVRPRLLDRLAAMCHDTDATLQVLTLPEQRDAVVSAAAAVLASDAEDPAVQAELTAWPTPGPEPFETADGEPARDAQILAGCPTLALITTANDDAMAWLGAGEALVRVLLRARVDHVQASYLHGPLRTKHGRFTLAETTGALGTTAHSAGFAQLALRLGYGADVPAQPRRPWSSFLRQ